MGIMVICALIVFVIFIAILNFTVEIKDSIGVTLAISIMVLGVGLIIANGNPQPEFYISGQYEISALVETSNGRYDIYFENHPEDVEFIENQSADIVPDDVKVPTLTIYESKPHEMYFKSERIAILIPRGMDLGELLIDK